MDLMTLKTFLGWCTVINFALLLVTSFFMTVMKGTIMSIHTRITGLPEDVLNPMYVKFLGYYKIAIFIFNFTPWLALHLMS